MRASIGSILGVLAASGCSHHGEPTTENIRQETAYAEAETSGGMAKADQNLDCPMQVPGTTVRTEETSSGPALSFTTTGDVDDLRMRVRRLAAQENRAAGQAAGPTPSKPKGSVAKDSGFPNPTSSATNPDSAAVPNMYSANSHEAPGGSISTQSDMLSQMEGQAGRSVPQGPTATRPAMARAESTESGSRLVFVIEDASQLERVRDRVQVAAQSLSAGRCSMQPVQDVSSAMQPQYQRPAAGAASATPTGY